MEASQGFSFASWYKDNKEALSKKRKERYATDAAYREQHKEASKAYRLKCPKRKSSRQNYLNIDSFCVVAGMSPHTYRKYQSIGWIPVLHHRVIFTQKHLTALSALAIAARAVKYTKKGRFELLEPYINEVKKVWNSPPGFTDEALINS
jgi:hypothetical protein